MFERRMFERRMFERRMFERRMFEGRMFERSAGAAMSRTEWHVATACDDDCATACDDDCATARRAPDADEQPRVPA
jgi:hypothetical protein